MPVEATESTAAAPVVPADIDIHLLRELVGDQGTFREKEMEDDTGSELSKLESSMVEGMEVDAVTGRPNFARAATGADRRVESTQEFFRRSNCNGQGSGLRDDDGAIMTPQRVGTTPQESAGRSDKKFWRR